LKIFDIFRKKKTPAGEDLFKQKYQTFQKLLDANNAALEIMSRLEKVSEGDFVFDLQYVRAQSEAILEKCQEIIDELNVLGDDRYTALVPTFEAIKTKIQHEIASRSTRTGGPLVLPLSRIDRRLLLEVGGKNANLGEIKNRVQLPTPDGFVLTAEAYRQVLAENNLTPGLAAFLAEVDPDNLADLTAKSRGWQEQILQAQIPHRLAEEVHQQYERLARDLGRQPRLALRSSGLYEDQGYSFAGQFLTKLNVSLEQFFPAYVEVVASQFSPSALVYHERGLSGHGGGSGQRRVVYRGPDDEPRRGDGG